MRTSYHYQGPCPVTGQLLRLERTPAAEAAALKLVQELPELKEGKMFGVLLTAEGKSLRAFSGLQSQPGWAPPIHTPESGSVPAQLDRLKCEIQQLAAHEAFARLQELQEAWQGRLADFQLECRRAKQNRDELRRQGQDGPALALQSQREGTALRQLRARCRSELQPLEAAVAELRGQISERKKQRRELSASLQSQLHEQLSSVLSAGQPWSLASLFPAGPPTGTGECCAPKLLHQAASLGLTPIAMAEVWWGPPLGERRPGEFYAACAERCQPLIGPLLGRVRPLEILHHDEHLLAVVKPPGVLTLPGRQSWNQDSLWSRLRRAFPGILPVHRLDMETSGISLWALSPECQRDLQGQFARQQVEKLYEALLSRQPSESSGCLELALAPDPGKRGCYRIDPAGKASRTHFRQLADLRYQFQPRSGRSHQIRVHAAQGLGCPIAGDRLYGGGEGPLRLHARRLRFQHQDQTLILEAPPPF